MKEDEAARRARALVCVRSRQPGGPWFVDLLNGQKQSVELGPYENPAIARQTARRIREYLAALVRKFTAST